MSNAIAVPAERLSLIADMARRYSMEPKAFADTLRATVIPSKATNEEFAAFLMVAREYGLNPIIKEIYAYPKQGGGIQPIVSVDGWANLINSHPQCDGIEFDDVVDENDNLRSVTCRIYRKDRSRPTTATEYMVECKQGTTTWQKWPRRMLRHKALIQAARYAFGFAGIVDPDEAERFTVTPQQQRVSPPSPPPAPVSRQIAPPSPPEPEPASDLRTQLTASLEEETTAFYERLDAAMSAADTPEDVEQVWADLDVEQRCADDLDVPNAIKTRRLGEIRRRK